MQRDILLLTEMIDAAEQAHQLTAGITIGQLETDRQRRDALLWNFTVLGEYYSRGFPARGHAAAQRDVLSAGRGYISLPPSWPPLVYPDAARSRVL